MLTILMNCWAYSPCCKYWISGLQYVDENPNPWHKTSITDRKGGLHDVESAIFVIVFKIMIAVSTAVSVAVL